MLKKAFFTICAKNYIHYARTLFDSLRENYPDCTFYLMLADRSEGYPLDLGEKVNLVEAEELPVDNVADMAFRYDITEFNTAIKPAAFMYLFNTGLYESVIYLDPDIFVVSPLDEVHALLEGGAKAVLTPHICQPVDDGEKPDDLSMLRAGVYNLGFLALNRCEEVSRVLDWWHNKLSKDCRIDLDQGLFVDQKWMDMLPSFLPDTAVLRHPGYNAAYWNLMHRHIEYVAPTWYSNNKPLRFFHFSGVDMGNDQVFSKHQARFTMNNIGDLKKLAQQYRRQVMENGQARMSVLPYAYSKTANGENIPTILRRIFRESVEMSIGTGEEPYAALVNWCNMPEESVVQTPGIPVSRVMYRVWQAREDLQLAFDLATETGRMGLLNWYGHSAEHDFGLDSVFLPALDQACCVTPETGEQVVEKSGVSSGGKRLRRFVSRSAAKAMAFTPRLQPVYRYVSPPVRQRIRVSLIKLVSMDSSATGQSVNVGTTAPALPPVADTAQNNQDLRAGALLVGYPKAELGMGEHVRLSAQSFMEADLPFGVYNFDHSVVARQEDDRYSTLITDKPEYKANIFHINADQMEVARDVLGGGFFNGRYNIGYWAWELSRFPDEWLPATQLVDEIWAPSKFIQHSISEKARCPVVWMPLAVKAAPLNKNLSMDFGVSDDDFVFMFYFDFASFATRKNPEASIEAFRHAFDGREDNVRLVIKVMGNFVHQPEIERLKKRVSSDPRIVVIDKVLSHEEMALLVNRCDCFVSLHRSEGFGRGMAEAMIYGKPVIATNYSGNTDFMNHDNALLVDYALVPVKKGCYVHWENQVWAEPDLEQAACHMRKVFEDREYANRIGLAGKAYIEQHHSPDVVAARYRERLGRIGLL